MKNWRIFVRNNVKNAEMLGKIKSGKVGMMFA